MAIAETIPIYFSSFCNQPLNLAGHVAMQNEDYFSQIPISLQLDMAVRPSSDHWNVSKCIEYQPRKFLKGGTPSSLPFFPAICHVEPCESSGNHPGQEVEATCQRSEQCREPQPPAFWSAMRVQHCQPLKLISESQKKAFKLFKTLWFFHYMQPNLILTYLITDLR